VPGDSAVPLCTVETDVSIELRGLLAVMIEVWLLLRVKRETGIILLKLTRHGHPKMPSFASFAGLTADLPDNVTDCLFMPAKNCSSRVLCFDK